MARKRTKKKATKGQSEVRKVMREFARGNLKGGKGKHPKVRSRAQAIAIALSEARKSGARIPKKGSRKKRG